MTVNEIANNEGKTESRPKFLVQTWQYVLSKCESLALVVVLTTFTARVSIEHFVNSTFTVLISESHNYQVCGSDVEKLEYIFLRCTIPNPARNSVKEIIGIRGIFRTILTNI